MVLIFCFSAQDATASSKTSGTVVQKLCEAFYPEFGDISGEKQAAIISSFQFIARKSAHFLIYVVLGNLSLLAVISYKGLKFSVRPLIAAAICLIYAASDEFHQYFVPGRSCELRDMCIDFSGAVTGILLLLLIVRLIKPLRTYFE